MHIPVLLKEAIKTLDPKSGEFFIDGTFGGGGHAKAILEKIGARGKLLGIDWNKKAIERDQLPNVILVQDNFAHLS
ncbi:MAG: 16S rRNA (cytosine(1402)-N(4))-methyltransferase, partial [Patescibacteria group bacterium]